MRALRGRAATTATAALLAAGALVLAGCGSSSAPGPDASTSASSDPAAQPSVPPVEWTGDTVPTVDGSFGAKPTLTFSDATPLTELARLVASEGAGAVVASGDLLAVDYLGQVYGGKVFDNSYDRKEPAAFGIGTSQVIAGWDNGLVGMKVGSRVLLSIPPDQGYGPDGNTQAGITGTDTLVFVVDIVGTYPTTAGGQPDATPADAAPPGVTVGGELGAVPTVSVAKDAAKPKDTSTTVLATGTGEELPEGLAVLQYVAVDWDDQPVESTWETLPAATSLSKAGGGTPFDSLVGVPVGSRVLLELPEGQSGGPYAVVVDVVAHAPTAAQYAAG